MVTLWLMLAEIGSALNAIRTFTDKVVSKGLL